MTSSDILVQLISKLDRTTLGCVDDCPPDTAWIDFVAPPEAPPEGGKFHPEHVQIDIYRPGSPPTPRGSPLDAARASPSPTRELIWLAHELGHLQSKLRGNAVSPQAASGETYAEEIRAWYFGRQLLSGYDFEQWSMFDEMKEAALRGYREGLRLSDTEAYAISDATVQLIAPPKVASVREPSFDDEVKSFKGASSHSGIGLVASLLGIPISIAMINPYTAHAAPMVMFAGVAGVIISAGSALYFGSQSVRELFKR